ncbi:MAG: citrate transporter [Acetatifactor sp.]|nr:citrate transporter [Acetatifactor sp.]
MKKGFFNRMISFVKTETVLCIALLLAAVSAFLVPPDGAYVEYIDFRTLAILFCLMGVMAGHQEVGVFRLIAERLLLKVKIERQLVLILVALCFFFSMFITNDVALITFVPFTFTVLKLMNPDQAHRLIIPVVVLQTVAANLGSMLTPVGNPQNLYLYAKSGISIGTFLWLMFPYALLALVLLTVWCMVLGSRGKGSALGLSVSFDERTSLTGLRWKLSVYLVLFVLCLLTVVRVIPYGATLLIVLAALFLMDKKVLLRVDYSLLFTFVGFFVFIGNMGRIPAFYHFLQSVVSGNETVTAIVASQIISNVPAALLLSGFTDNYSGLIVGTNLGGLGTLIASMASLISYKYVVRECPERKGAYLGYFTVTNICFLAAMVILYMMIG